MWKGMKMTHSQHSMPCNHLQYNRQQGKVLNKSYSCSSWGSTLALFSPNPQPFFVCSSVGFHPTQLNFTGCSVLVQGHSTVCIKKQLLGRQGRGSNPMARISTQAPFNHASCALTTQPLALASY